MNILICGATGFVGRHLSQHLQQAGHQIIRAIRQPTRDNDIPVNFVQDTVAASWLPRLTNIDVVINAVGVLRNHIDNPMQRLHTDTPCALFQACKQAGIKRVVHISALGVDSGVEVPYFSTRLSTEQQLPSLLADIPWLCLRPSVIYGEDGASASMFRQMARLPLQVLPLGGSQRLQPVHIDDICDAVSNWLTQPHSHGITVAAVGAEATTMRAMLDSYRQQLGHGHAWHIGLPRPVVSLMAKAGDMLPASPLCSDTYAMMAAGNTADASAFTRLLGRPPLSYRQFIQHETH